jgi:flagellar basal-body rod modification protein FlgD
MTELLLRQCRISGREPKRMPSRAGNITLRTGTQKTKDNGRDDGRRENRMTNPVSNTSGAGTAPESTTGAAAKQSEISKDAFLQLLVAQVKNQDPLNPTDGVQFLTQLAQFSQLEQMIGMRADLGDIATELKKGPATTENTGAKNV